MRNSFMLSTAALLFASAGVAGAQQSGAARDTASPMVQSLDVGYRGSAVDGDRARWERFRDLRDGVLSRFNLSNETGTSAFRLSAANIGYRDQQIAADYNQFGKLKVTAAWNSTPLNYAYNTLTPWKDQGNNVWTLDSTARAAVQNKTPGVLGIGTTAANYGQPSIFRGLATPFAMQSRRDVISLGVKYRLTDVTGVEVAFSSTRKEGNQPYGASFAFNDANELPMAVDNRTNDVTAGFDWTTPKVGTLRAEWTGSWFKNQFSSLTWDNPLRATDYSNGKAPPAGPYDASGYSNGNGPATGRLALPPSNSLNTFRVLGLYKMPRHTTLNGQLSFTTMKQNEALLPWTTNSSIANPAVYALFPGLATMERPTAEADVRGLNALVSLTTRPTELLAFDLRYRYNNRENHTPVFDASNSVRFDAVPENVPGTETEQFNIRESTLETGATYTMPHNTSLRLGYILDDFKRTGRAFTSLADNTLRLSLDSYGNQFLMVRGVFETTRRKGSGFSEEVITDGGAQPGLRFYDDAEMDRNKGTLIVHLTPTEQLELGASVAAGKDIYNGDGQEYGLLSNSNASYNFTFNIFPANTVTLGGNAGYEKYSSLQKSRNGNPLSGVAGRYESFNDPNRDWNLNNDETVRNAGLFVDLIKALPKTDIRFSYDYSASDNAFIHSGPRIDELSTNTALTVGDTKPCAAGLTSCFIPLPAVTNSWHQMKVDVKHMFSSQLGVGVGLWYEKFDVTDYATTNLPDGTPQMDPLGGITTGYGNRPYSGTTGMVRLIYKF